MQPEMGNANHVVTRRQTLQMTMTTSGFSKVTKEGEREKKRCTSTPDNPLTMTLIIASGTRHLLHKCVLRGH